MTRLAQVFMQAKCSHSSAFTLYRQCNVFYIVDIQNYIKRACKRIEYVRFTNAYDCGVTQENHLLIKINWLIYIHTYICTFGLLQFLNYSNLEY